MAGRETKERRRGVQVTVRGLVPVPREARRRGEGRTLRALDPTWVFPVDPAQRGVVVRGVWADPGWEGNLLVWAFDVPVTAVAGDGAPQLLASGDGVNFVAPDTVLAGDDGTVLAIYDNAAFSLTGGVTFRLDATPTTITFAQGRAVVPQTGLTIAPPAIPSASAGMPLTPAALRLTAHARPARKPRRAA